MRRGLLTEVCLLTEVRTRIAVSCHSSAYLGVSLLFVCHQVYRLYPLDHCAWQLLAPPVRNLVFATAVTARGVGV